MLAGNANGLCYVNRESITLEDNITHVLFIAMKLASILNSDFDNDWACWQSLDTRDRYANVCEYDTFAYNLSVNQKWDNEIVVEFNPYFPPYMMRIGG